MSNTAKPEGNAHQPVPLDCPECGCSWTWDHRFHDWDSNSACQFHPMYMDPAGVEAYNDTCAAYMKKTKSEVTNVPLKCPACHMGWRWNESLKYWEKTCFVRNCTLPHGIAMSPDAVERYNKVCRLYAEQHGICIEEQRVPVNCPDCGCKWLFGYVSMCTEGEQDAVWYHPGWLCGCRVQVIHPRDVEAYNKSVADGIYGTPVDCQCGAKWRQERKGHFVHPTGHNCGAEGVWLQGCHIGTYNEDRKAGILAIEHDNALNQIIDRERVLRLDVASELLEAGNLAISTLSEAGVPFNLVYGLLSGILEQAIRLRDTDTNDVL